MFKVGDEVICINDEDGYYSSNGVNVLGTVSTITEISKTAPFPYITDLKTRKNFGKIAFGEREIRLVTKLEKVLK